MLFIAGIGRWLEENIVTVWVRRSHRTRLQTCLFKAWRPNPLGQLSAEHINYYTQTIACFFLNWYRDTSISDGLVCLLVVCHICEWQRLIIAGDWINVCGWTECRDLGRADVYFQALTAGPWFIQCLHTAKQIEQSHQKLPHNMLACQISLNRTRTDSLTSVSQMVLGYSPKTLRKYCLVSTLSIKLNIII